MSDLPPICDYEGSDYRTRFWQNQGRDYEDQAERIALRRMLPPNGSTLLDIGAGFGRLVDEYSGYQNVVLLDYSKSLLQEARERHGRDQRILYVAANWYEMPFVSGLFETMVQVRTIHHAADAPQLIAELARIARPNGHYILEFANKQNLKAMARYALGKQDWSPYEREPIEFVEMNFDFHPQWMLETLRSAEFTPRQILTVSHFRIPILKKLVPTKVLVTLDSAAQYSGNWWQLTPSVFVYNRHPQTGEKAAADHFFACPKCQTPLVQTEDQLPCKPCGLIWMVEDGVYNFKEPKPI